MIYTVTLAPSIDCMMDVNNFELGKINRSNKQLIVPGGKGVNVSIVLNNLGDKSVSTGFIGGFTGKYIKHSLNDLGIVADFVEIPGLSRINIKIKSNVETALDGIGLDVNNDNINELLERLSYLDQDDVLVLSGSIPKNMSILIYDKILRRIHSKKTLVFVDSNKDGVLSTLKYKPFLIKPNQDELEEIIGKKIESEKDIEDGAKKLLNLGAQNVIVSLGEKGAFMIGEGVDPTYERPYNGVVKNTVGAGDSLLAGFIHEYLRTNDIYGAFKFGVKIGTLSAYSESLPKKEDIEKLLEE